jgi:rod shape-determining protein MreC
VAAQSDRSPDYLRGLRRIVLAIAALGLFGLFLLWRIDNPRVEQLRMSLVDRFVPGFEWALQPVAATTRLIADFRSYARVYEQNVELRREVQRMQGWREAALQLEQKNAQLLALNNVRLSPRLTFVTGEVLADSGSPFRQSVLVNTGSEDGVADGAAVVDGLGLVGRIAGVGGLAARVLMITDASSRLPVVVRPSGQRALLAGDNRAAPLIEFLEQSDAVRAGDRVVTSADGGILPSGILVGQMIVDPDGRLRVRPAADLRRLDFVRVVRMPPPAALDGPGDMIGPRLAVQPLAEAVE